MGSRWMGHLWLLVFGLGSQALAEDAAKPTSPTEVIVLSEFLVVPATGSYGRAPLHRDAIEASLVLGNWTPPVAGQPLATDAGQPAVWKQVQASADGELDVRTYRGGYAYIAYNSPADRIVVLEARGHAAAYVNGQPQAGDPYSLGFVRLPIQLKTGDNHFLFHLSDDHFHARLVPATEAFFLNADDLTLPSVGPTGPSDNEDKPPRQWGGVPIVNGTTEWLNGARLVCAGGRETLGTTLPSIAPLSVYKAPFAISASTKILEEDWPYELQLLRPIQSTSKDDTGEQSEKPRDEVLAKLSFSLLNRTPGDVQICTFRSTVDGSTQKYAARPAKQPPEAGDPGMPRLGTIVALHDKGETCCGFAERLSQKTWAHVVVPTGRRPFGFDWEDWSRIDALEALGDAQSRFYSDPNRTFLTGYSMGGHGAWHLGVTYPSRFTAIGPVAAWASFWSYGGGMPIAKDHQPIQEMLLRGYSPSDTIKLIGNLRDTGVCIQHGADDVVVPVAQSRYLRSRLADFHSKFAYFETPGVGHEAARAMCDSGQLLEFFQHQSPRQPSANDFIDFVTAHPGVGQGVEWVSIEAQRQQFRPSRVAISRNREQHAISAKTINVARLSVKLDSFNSSRRVRIDIDGQSLGRITKPEEGKLWFEFLDGRWQLRPQPPLSEKGPHRYGGFKSVFNHDPVLVYGTTGTEEENTWAKSKAKFDAETFWYRGNGSLEVIADRDFRPLECPDCNVVLYGNAETNSAWPALLSMCPVQVRRGSVRIGPRPETGDDLAVLFVCPRAGSDRALVGVVSGTSAVGMRLTTRLRYFVSGVAYPDLLVFGPGVLTDGPTDIRALGYFGLDWHIDTGEIIWRDVAL